MQKLLSLELFILTELSPSQGRYLLTLLIYWDKSQVVTVLAENTC